MPGGVVRSWMCLNARCATRFDAWEANPECPSCHCVRVQWCPAGGHVGGGAKAADADLRALADLFKMGDINSAQRGRAAKQVAPTPVLPQGGPARTFAPGFVANAPVDRAVCVPSQSKVDFKVAAGIGNRLSPNKTFANVRSNTMVEATHKP